VIERTPADGWRTPVGIRDIGLQQQLDGQKIKIASA
jgi:hypothetical protein